MNKRRGGVVLIAFGLLAAAFVGFMVYRLAQQSANQRVQTVDVLVAMQDIPERTVLTPALVGMKAVLPGSLPPGVLTRPDQAGGRMVTSKIFAGEMIVAGRLVDSSGRSGVAYSLEKGKVLVTLPSSDIVGTGAVRQGDHVDLLVTLLPGEAKQGPGVQLSEEDLLPAITQTTMQNLVVVGIGPFSGLVKEGSQPQGGNNSAGNLITFAVDHQDALRLKAMKDHKRVKLELVLRAAGDDEVVETAPVTLQSIIEAYRINKQ